MPKHRFYDALTSRKGSALFYHLINTTFFNKTLKDYYYYNGNDCMINYHWNDRRSRRVFRCFSLAIFKLASAKYQTFVYNSRTFRFKYEIWTAI